MSYHLVKIEKGVLGEFSKIKEEFEEYSDAMIQKDPILSLCELSDIVGATDYFLKTKFDLNFDHILYVVEESKVYNRPTIISADHEMVTHYFKHLEDVINKGISMADTIVLLSDFFFSIKIQISELNLTLKDLKKFSDKTVSSFISGKRS